MTKETGLGDRLYVGGYDLSGDINSLKKIGGGNKPIDLTDITQSAHARAGGLLDGNIDFTAYFNPASARAHPVLRNIPRTDVLVTYGHGATLGAPGAAMIAKQADYAPKRGDDGSFLIDVATLANGYGLTWGEQLTAGVRQDSAAVAAAGTTAIDLGSASPGAFGLVMYVNLMAITGTSVTIKLQESSDNSGDAYTDVVGATTGALTTARQGLRIATGAIAVERYLKVVTVGTFSDAQFQVLAFRHPIATSY